jgi:hypothetical protein
MYLTLLTYDANGDYDMRNITYCDIKNAKECSEMVYKADQYSDNYTAWAVREYYPNHRRLGIPIMMSGNYKNILCLIDAIREFV